MIVKTYVCPSCGHRTRIEQTPDHWDDPAPRCAACAARMGQDFQPFGILGAATAARRIAEASAVLSQASTPTLVMSSTERAAIVASAAHVREDITEHRAPPPVPHAAAAAAHPAARGQMLSAMAYGRAYREKNGASPLALAKQAMTRGDLPDPRKKVIR